MTSSSSFIYFAIFQSGEVSCCPARAENNEKGTQRVVAYNPTLLE